MKRSHRLKGGVTASKKSRNPSTRRASRNIVDKNISRNQELAQEQEQNEIDTLFSSMRVEGINIEDIVQRFADEHGDFIVYTLPSKKLPSEKYMRFLVGVSKYIYDNRSEKELCKLIATFFQSLEEKAITGFIYIYDRFISPTMLKYSSSISNHNYTRLDANAKFDNKEYYDMYNKVLSDTYGDTIPEEFQMNVKSNKPILLISNTTVQKIANEFSKSSGGYYKKSIDHARKTRHRRRV